MVRKILKTKDGRKKNQERQWEEREMHVKLDEEGVTDRREKKKI